MKDLYTIHIEYGQSVVKFASRSQWAKAQDAFAQTLANRKKRSVLVLKNGEIFRRFEERGKK